MFTKGRGKRLRSFFALSMVVILLVGMLNLNNLVSAETLEDVKPEPTEEVVNSPEPSVSSKSEGEEQSESPSPSASIPKQEPADSPKPSEQQDAVFSGYDKNKAQVLGALTKQSYADNTLVAQATVSVVGQSGVTSVYRGLRAEISDGKNTLKSLDLKDLGVGDIHNFTVKVSNLVQEQYSAYVNALQLKVYLKDECIAVAAFDKGAPIAAQASPLSDNGVAPIRLIVTPNANDTVQSGVIEKLTGNSAVVSITTSASAMDGAVVLVPVKNNAYSDVKFAALSSPDVKTGVLNNYTFTYEGKTVSGDFIVAVIPNAGSGSFLASMSVEYTFENGITPAGATQTITGYALEGKKVSGEGLFGSGIAVLADGASDKGATYTYKAKLDETITVEKSIISVTDSDVMFADLKERSYRDVVVPTPATDDYYVNYQIALKTSGNGKFEGRLFNKSIKITDTLSGFLATGTPKSITVKTTGGAIVAVYDEKTVGTTHEFSFDVPVINTESLTNQTYIVAVKYSKNDYTNRHNQAPVLSAPQVISNKADAAVTPVAGSAYKAEGNTVQNAFGYVQEEPLTPSLSIEKKIIVSGQTYTYDTAMQGIYGVEGSPVTFSMKPVGGGQAQTVNIGTDGKAKFENLVPGTTYTLSETVGVSTLFEKVSDITVVVSPLDNNGLATVKINDVDYTSKALVVNNTGTFIGSIRAQATKQNLHEYPAKYSNYVGVQVLLYDAANMATPVASAVTDAQGYVIFHNLDTRKTYKLVGADEPSGNFDTPSVTGVVAKADSFELYALQYKSNKGSFMLGKAFVGPDGNAITVNNFEATFQLYATNGTAVGDPIKVTSKTAAVVQQLYSAGTYVLKEVGLKINGVDASDQYTLFGGNTITVAIVAGEYGIKPVDASSENRVDANGVFTNKSAYGQLKIKNYAFNGTALRNFTYTITDVNGVLAPVTVAMSSSESEKTILLPAGTYKVTQTLKAGYILLTANEKQISVAGGTPVSDTITITGLQDGQVRALEGEGTAVQTVAFINAMLPNVSGKKIRKDNNATISGAQFALYVKDGVNYVPYKSSGSHYSVSSNTSGVFTFASLPEGAYAFVETVVPTGYMAPAYRATFYEADGTTLKQSVPAASIGAAPTFSVNYSNYSHQTNTINLTNNEENVRYASATINMGTTDKQISYLGGTFTLYDSNTVALGTANPTNAGFVKFYDTGNKEVQLAPGTYTVKQTAMTGLAENYVMRDDVVTITVSENGGITATFAPNMTTTYKNSAIASDVANNAVKITFTNAIKPSVKYSKRGETNVFDDKGNRKQSVLAGAKFVVEFKQNETTKYMQFDAAFKMTGVTTDRSQATELVSNEFGEVFINFLDPLVSGSYKLVEISAPPVPETDLEYKLGDWGIHLQLVTDADSSYYHVDASAGINDNGYAVITNKIDPHHIMITKYRLQEENGVITEMSSNYAINGEFHVYRWDEKNGAYDMSEPVDIMKTGSGGLDNTNTAFSRQLPAGKYLVVEVVAPLGAVSVDSADAAIYVKEDDQWVKKSSAAEDHVLQFEVVLGGNEEVKALDVGNIGYATGGGSANYARLYGEKVGYAMDVDGNLTLQGPIMGVSFDVYLGYVDNTSGAYVKMGAEPYETVKSGSVWKDNKLQSGQFLTSFISKGQFMAAATVAGVSAADIKNYSFILVEKGPLPENYRPIGSAQPEFGYSIDFDVNYLQTIGAEGSEKTPVEIRNIAGEGFLRIRKYGQKDTTTLLTGAEFELYSATKANAPESEWQYVGKVNPSADQVASTYSLLPGYYFIKEVTAESGFNTYGQYRVDGGARKDFDGVIGGIAIHDNKVPVVLDVYDKEYASLQVQNYWNGGSDTGVDATYKIEYVAGTSTYATNQVVVSASTVQTITGLPDGTYKITEVNLTGTKAEEYLKNTATATYGIEVVVEKGAIASIKTNGETLPTLFGTYDVSRASDNSKLNINHKSKGALIIQKGHLNASGMVINSVPGTLTQAVFNIEKYDDGLGSYVSAGTITWTSADATTGKKVLLESGAYRITEASTSTGYSVDPKPVYVDIDAVGAVYLRNNIAKYGIESSQANPLNATNSSAKGYFYNRINLGTLQIYKAASASSTTYLSGAMFEVYTSPAGEAASKVNATFTASNGVYSADLVPGTYYIKEITAPTGYDVREGLFKVEVKANTAPVYKGYENAGNENTICILDAALVSITVEKTTTYPSIDDGTGGVLLPEAEARVAGMPIQLYKYNGTTYELLKDTATVYGSANVHGTVSLTGLGVGKYKIVEFSPADGSLDYLNLNQKYNLANIETAPVIEIKYDAATNALVVDASAVGSDWNASKSMLTIDNEFIGVRFAAKKVDIETGNPVVGAVFELYEHYDPKTGVVSDKVSSNTITYSTDATGVVYFDPMYLQTGTTYYIKEVNVPGYIIDAYYDTDVKAVTATREGIQVLATFKNKKMPVDPVLSVVKSTDAAPENPLRDEGFSATYTIAQTALGLKNDLPLVNYTVKDTGPKFYGKNINDVDIPVSEVSGHKPGYTITSVKVYLATAKLSYDAEAKAVYANVNGTGWKLLAAPYTEFAVAAEATGIEVVYASTIPAQGENAVVGTSFLPGKIEVDVTYDSFEPLDATQPEVTKIVNTATIDANYRDITKGANVLKALKQAKDDETIALSVKDRPKMDVEKALLTDVIKGPGETLEYKLTLTNKSTATGSGDNSHLNIVDPVIVDVMQENVLFASVDGNGKPIYTVSGDATAADVAACNMYEGGRIVEWKFTGLNLAPGESIEITYTAQLAAVIGGSTVDNAVYATSSAPLSYSTKYPTGAMFTSYNPAKGVSAGAEYDLLKGHTGISGLYVKATKNDVKIKRSGQVNAQRSISTDGSTWVSSSDIPLDVYPGDTIYYRLQVQNDGADNAPSLDKIRIADILPFLGDDKFTGGDRGTQWSDELINLWKISSNISVSNTAGTVSDYTVKYSAARALAGITSGAAVSKEEANSFMITFGDSFKLVQSDTLTIVFSMKLPEYADFTDSMLQNNVRKTAVASFLPIFEYLQSEFNNAESNMVKARLLLPKVNVTGSVWDDANRDGIMGAQETKLSGVPVSLYASTDNGLTFTQVGQTTNSGADGSYTFTGLESSYGEGAPVYKVVFENANSATKQFSPGVAFGGASSADNKSHIVNVSSDKTKGDTGAIKILTNSVVNAGINGIPSYTVTYAPGTAGGNATNIPVYNATLDSVLQGGTYSVRGSSPTPAWPGSGYSFDGWTVTADTSGSLNMTAGYYGPASTFTMPGNNVSLTAKWKENTKYTVSYTAGTGVTNAVNIPGSDSVATGKLYGVKGTGGAGDATPTRPGYTFAGWTVVADSSSTLTTVAGYYKPNTGTGSFTMPGNNVTLEANWTVNYWTVTYATEGTVSGMPSQTVVTGVQALTTFNVSDATPTRYGFAFKGWKVTSGKASGMQDVYQPEGSFTMPDNNVVLTAQWVPTYQVTYNGDGATSGVPTDNAWYEAADTVTLKAGTPVKAGFAFKGWKVTVDTSNTIINNVYENPQTFAMPGNNVTLTAQWAPTYTVTYAGNGATSGVPVDNDRYEANVTYNVKSGTPIKEGFTFAGWSTNFDAKTYPTTGSFAMPAQNVVLTATWTKNYWKVTYVSETGTTGMPSPAVVTGVQALSTFNVETGAPTRFGFNFKGWRVTGGKSSTMAEVYAAGGSFTMPDNDVELTAQWVPTYTVTYNANGATSGVPSDTARYEATNTVNVKNGTPFKEGFTFAGWATNFDSTTYQGGGSFTMPAKDVVLTATWAENYWKVTYVSETGTTGMPSPAVVENVLALSTFNVENDEPTRFGFNFKGWQVTSGKSATMNAAYQAGGSFTMPDNNVELTAIWEPTYTVTYNGLGATSGVPTDTARYETGEEVVVKNGTPVRAGYAFKGWLADFDNGTYIAGEDFTMPSANVVLTAIWAPTYTVTYNGNGATSGVPSDTARYEAGDVVTVLSGIPVRENYVFKGWRSSDDNATYAAGNTFAMPNGNVVLTAIWDPTYTVSYDGDGATSGVPSDTARYEVGDVVTVLSGTPVRENYVFKGWRSSDDNATYAANETFAMPNDDVVLTAIWDPTYTVSYDGNGATSGVPSDTARYEVGDVVTVLSSTPVRKNFVFKGWRSSDDGATYAANETFAMPNDDVVLTAIWDPTYTVSYDGNGATSGVPSDTARYEVGDVVTVLSGTPVRKNFVFKGWRSSQNGATYAANNTFAMPNGDVVLTAVWDPTYTVSYDGNGATSGVPSDTTRYEAGDTLTVATGTPVRAGYTFNGWLYSGRVYQAGQTIAMPNGDVVLVAQWTAVPTPTPSPSPSPSGSVNPSPSPSVEPSVSPSVSTTPSVTPSVIPSVDQSASPEPTQSTKPTVEIEDRRTPLYGGERNYWSLLSLLMSLAGLITAILIFASIFKRNKKNDADMADDENEPRKKRSKLLKAFVSIMGVLVGVIWLLLDNLRLRMAFINGYTIYVAIAFLVMIMLLLVERSVKKKDKTDDEEKEAQHMVQ